ncbi:hypothetical protein SGRIM128S_08913 [Streptomyces griseomycini]
MPVSLTFLCAIAANDMSRPIFGDVAVSEPGLPEADVLGAALPGYSVAVRGPSPGCARTAQALAVTAEVEPALRDFDYGEWHGRTVAEIAATDPYGLSALLTDPDAVPHGGESVRQLLPTDQGLAQQPAATQGARSGHHRTGCDSSRADPRSVGSGERVLAHHGASGGRGDSALAGRLRERALRPHASDRDRPHALGSPDQCLTGSHRRPSGRELCGDVAERCRGVGPTLVTGNQWRAPRTPGRRQAGLGRRTGRSPTERCPRSGSAPRPPSPPALRDDRPKGAGTGRTDPCRRQPGQSRIRAVPGPATPTSFPWPPCARVGDALPPAPPADEEPAGSTPPCRAPPGSGPGTLATTATRLG